MYKSFIGHKKSPRNKSKIDIKPYSRKNESEIHPFLRNKNEYENTIDDLMRSKIKNLEILRPKSEEKYRRKQQVNFTRTWF